MAALKRCLLIVGIAFLLALLYGRSIAFRDVYPPPDPWFTLFVVTFFYTLAFSVIGIIGYSLYKLCKRVRPWMRPFVIAFALALMLATAFIGMLVMTGGLLREEEYQLGYILMLIASWTIAGCGVFGLIAVPFAAGYYFEERRNAAAKR